MIAHVNNCRILIDVPILDTAYGRTPSCCLMWFMRQAGRLLPEYRKVHKGIGMLDLCFRSGLLAETTMQSIHRHGVDAAILFSGVVVPLKATGINPGVAPGRGPATDTPVRSETDVKALPEVAEEQLAPIAEGVGPILQGLTDTQTLIGFTGAPFTLASHLIESGLSCRHECTKTLMYSDPKLWDHLIQKITPMAVVFPYTQISAGVDATQLFDSWVGYLTERDYCYLVLSYSKEIFQAVAGAGIPCIHFGVGTGELLGAMAGADLEAMGVDWRVLLNVTANRICTTPSNVHRGVNLTQNSLVLQGSLNPAILFTGEAAMTQEIQRICSEADHAIKCDGARGYILNLGHGVLPSTDVDAITHTVEIIHAARKPIQQACKTHTS